MTGSLFDQVIEVISQYTITTNYQYQIYHPRSQDQIILVGVILILIILITHIHTYKYKLYNTGIKYYLLYVFRIPFMFVGIRYYRLNITTDNPNINEWLFLAMLPYEDTAIPIHTFHYLHYYLHIELYVHIILVC